MESQRINQTDADDSLTAGQHSLSAWAQDAPETFSYRLASRYYLPSVRNLHSGRRTQAASNGTLVAEDGVSAYPYSESMTPSSMAVPSLSNGSQSVSEMSVGSRIASKVQVVNMLETDSTGNLVTPPPTAASHAEQHTPIYYCLFYTLPCDHKSDRVDTWKTHVLSHFRGCPLPPNATCQWCSADFVHDNGNKNHASRVWDAMLEHAAHEHFEKGHSLAATRPSFELMKYMYQSKIITEDQLKAIQLCPSPDSPAYHPSQDPVRARIGSSDEPYCSTYSPRREKRMREQRRGISVV
ncbi:hypothetical protein PISL3812_06019 [Talaromyces islandicus]|uniref:Uncharacterized protein n=1 Tax=Talaromyces islandicus TaxID=28573 RepID=A0A0U1M098_TALIS|nr:hypothetical protein PISL3812_06019 [Talaromyces islandicus]